MKINPNKLNGEDLFYYFTHDHDDEDYKSVVSLLPYALNSMDKAVKTFEKLFKAGRMLYVCYPPKDTPPDKSHILGDIPDGVLCYK